MSLQNSDVLRLERFRYPSHRLEPSMVAMLWSSTDVGFKLRKLQRNEAIERYGLKNLLKIVRKQDKPHIYKYICNEELNKFILLENEKRLKARFELIKMGIRKQIPNDIIKYLCVYYIYLIK